MALKKLLADLSIISKLGNNPGVDNGLSEEQIKAKFDEAANIIKDYINNYLLLQIEKTVDVESLLSDILDVTLSKVDKAANAAATGEAIRALRSFFEKVVHGGDYVLESDGCFSAEVLSHTTVHIESGVGVIQGNLFFLKTQDVILREGAYGLHRNDLVVVRCTRSERNELSYSLVGLTGTNTSGEPVDPEYIQSDINTDGTMHDFPLYRIKFSGLDITEVVPLFTPEETVFEAGKTIAERLQAQTQTQTIPITLTASGWISIPDSGFIQTITVTGLSDAKKACAYPIQPEMLTEKLALSEETAKIRACSRTGNGMTFECWEEKPVLDIPVMVEVYI